MLRHPIRRRAALFAVLVVLLMTPPALAAAAADATVARPAPVQEDEVFDADETEGTIDRVRFQLLGVAALTGALLVAYIWHTDPQRRLRVAIRRREDRERAAVEALEDEFVLPVDADGDLVDTPTPADDGDADGG